MKKEQIISNGELSAISAGRSFQGWVWYLYAYGEGIKEQSRLHGGSYVN